MVLGAFDPRTQPLFNICPAPVRMISVCGPGLRLGDLLADDGRVAARVEGGAALGDPNPHDRHLVRHAYAVVE